MDDDHYYDEDDVVGALGLRRRIPRRRGTPARRRAAPRSRRRVQAAVPQYLANSHAGKGAEFPLGFGTFQFVNAGVTSTILTAEPQRLCKPSRLVCVAARTSGALELLTITDIKVGTLSQLASGEALPWDMFSPDSVGTELELAECGPGVKIYMHVNVSAAPGVAQTIDISAALICDVKD